MIEKFIKLVEQNIPDTEDYGTTAGSFALNVGVIIYESLNLIYNYEEGRLTDISTMGTDTIDFLVMDIEGYDRMDIEKIASHELMKEEIQLQTGIINYLGKVSNVDEANIETLRLFQRDRKFNKLNLESILYS